MIAACYKMDLHCENEEYHGHMWNSATSDRSLDGDLVGAYDEYIGETWTECARAARANGWVISRDRTRAYCPHCKRRRGVK